MKKLILLFLIVHCTLTIDNCFSQVTQEWVARYNGPGNGVDWATSIAVDGPGNVYVTGWSRRGITGDDYATVKYNSSGVQQWIARYIGPGNSDYNFAYSIAVDGSGNVYVTGDGTGCATIKYNSSGDSLWVKRYNGTAFRSLAIDGSGNVYVTGHSTGIGTSDDYITIKYNSSGDSLWVKRYDGPGNSVDANTSLSVDGSGNVYVTGRSFGNGISLEYATLKYNSSGVQQWVARYDGPGNDHNNATSLAVDVSGNVYVTGRSSGNGTGDDYATIKYNSSGDSVWVARYNGPANSGDGASSIAVDDSGNVYVTGESTGSGTCVDFVTIKYNSSGDSLWVKRYNGPANPLEFANSLAIDGLGNVYVTGESNGSGTSVDYATIKYNSSGDSVWVRRYNGPGNSADGAISLAVDGSGNVYVTGYSTGSGTDKDYATIKYSQLVGITAISNEIPNQFSLSQNYPNPFNPMTVVRYSLLVAGMTTLTIFDVLGREVATLVNEQLNAGTYEVDWDASKFSSGVYYYRIAVHPQSGAFASDKLSANDPSAGSGQVFTETKMMVLVK